MRTELVALVLLAAGCTKDTTTPGADGGGVHDAVATVSPDMGTVITVTWKTDEAVSGHVAFGPNGELSRATPEGAAGTEHRAVLVGLTADTEVSWQIVSEGVAGEVSTVTTGSIPAELPAVTVEGENDRFTLTSLASDANVVLLFDAEGNIVWHHRDERGMSVFRSLVARDGTGIVYSSAILAGGPSPDSVFVKVPWDRSGETTIAVPDLAHDFVELPDGTLGALTYKTVDDVEGNALVEVAADGSTTEIWDSWDCYDPVTNPGDDPFTGWTHANAVDYDPAEDVYYVNLRNLGTIAKVDRATGSCLWSLGGTGGDIDVSGGVFLHQHQFDVLDGGILVFDNDGAVGNVSRALEYRLDEAAGTAEVVREIYSGDDPPLYSFIMGDVKRYEDGDTIVAWSVPGTIDRFAPDDTRVWRLKLVEGGPIGFLQTLTDLYGVGDP